ncbi:hypothetical protein [Sphaerochaeta globosa]|uniref:Lipoprotein n=1 Tax=Sphaerochaeta globosa (strain ATCC BAA-1886 / DSM 22777 / Buddy) TaxID=158189 RepID=F0RZW6_SPHGB|nr:hypothetical protein [Sphaerochaeta globosa]ADY13796.1 hypothetical protein SpiBuddy_1973 [Sphaerochaeta globosa str. Buddy]
MKSLLFSVVLVCMVFIGCHSESVEATYILSDGELACVAWVEADYLAVLLLDQQVVDGFAAYSKLEASLAIQHLCGLPARKVIRTSQAALASFGELATTLAVTVKTVERSQVDAQLRLEALTEGAPHLRKTLLADTLASITGHADPFGELQTVKQATVFDMRKSLAVSQNTDWERMRVHLKRYIEELRRYQRKE